MGTNMLHFGLVIFGLLHISESFKSTRQENIKADDGTSYKLNITTLDTEEDIEVLDTDGNPVITVDIFAKGYVLDKPENDTVCYLSEDKKTDNDDFCYTYVKMPKKNLTDDILQKCEDRDIFLLISKPGDCKTNGENEPSTTTPASETNEGHKRVKRAYCFNRYYLAVRYVRIHYCCKELFGNCVRYCYFYLWRLVRVTVRTCIW